MKKLIIVLFFGASLFGCPRKSGDPDADKKEPAPDAHADETEHSGLPKRVRLTPDVVAAAGIKTQAAARDRLPSATDLPGEIAADPNRSAQVSARIAGRMEKVAFNEGAQVRAGDVLAIVRAPELGELSSTVQSLAAKSAAARANADRLEALLKSGLASQQEALAARSEADSLDAEMRAAQERLRAVGGGPAARGSLPLVAPLSGTVVVRNAVVGQPVSPEQTIATIVDLSEVWFLARVFEQNLAKIRVGAAAEVQLNAYPNERFAGTVDYVARQIDPAARTVTARIRLTNRGDMLRLGLFGTARIDTGEPGKGPTQIVIPRSAVTEIGGKTIVFVRQADGDFDLHGVVLGNAALGRVEIVAGLREGEQVVVDGAFTLKSTVLKSSLQEEE